MQRFKIIFPITIRLGLKLSLIFFVLFYGCNNDNGNTLAINWNNNKATYLLIPQQLVNGKGNIPGVIEVRLPASSTSIIGKLTEDGHNFRFTPAVPFTVGLKYVVYHDGIKVGEIIIPKDHQQSAASIMAVYPQSDTLPENLLKIYIEFSSPMKEGDAVSSIHLLDDHDDTLRDIFLDLQPELWNVDRSVLTVWLDPGRIKRDLIPNKRMGNPLQAGKQYTLIISGDWKDAQGLAIGKPFKKTFFVGNRDILTPDPANWKIQLPANSSMQPLSFNLGETLDHYLLKETIAILDESGNPVKGEIVLINKDQGLEFQPSVPWKASNYKIQVENYLEDLAGNNLTGLFDRDLSLKEKKMGKNFLREFVMR